ncbi:MAG: hypothetical protein ACREJO_00055 [Phycisphaerales bacterium]
MSPTAAPTLSIADLFNAVPKLLEECHSRRAKLVGDLSQIEADIERLKRMGKTAPRQVKAEGSPRGPRGAMKDAVVALFSGEAKGKTLSRNDLIAAGVKAGNTEGSARAKLTALTKEKVIESAGRGQYKAGPNLVK